MTAETMAKRGKRSDKGVPESASQASEAALEEEEAEDTSAADDPRRTGRHSGRRPLSGATTVELPAEELPPGREPSMEPTLVDTLPGRPHDDELDEADEELDEADLAAAPSSPKTRRAIPDDGWDDAPLGEDGDASVRRELARLEEGLADAQHRLLESQAAAADMRQKLGSLRTQLAEVTAVRDELASQLGAAKLAGDESEDGLSDLREELAREREAHEATRAKLADAQSNGADPAAVDGLRAQVAALEARLSASGQADGGRDELERSLSQALEERNSLTRTLKRLERHHLNLRARLSVWIEEANETLSDRDGLETDAQSARAALRRARDYCESVDLALNVVGSELESARGGFSSALHELASTEQEAQGFQSRAAQFTDTVSTARTRIRAVTSALAELANGLDGLGGLIENEVSERRRLGDAVGNAFSLLEHHEDGLSQLAERLQSQRNALTGLAGELDAATEADELLQGEVARRDAAFREHLEELDPIEELIGDAETLITRVHSEPADADDSYEPVFESEPGGQPSDPPKRSTPPGWISAVPVVTEEGNDTVVSTLPALPALDRSVFQRLHDGSLRASERLAPLHSARPSIESARLSQSMEISAKAAFLVSCIDGTVTLGDLIDLSGLQHEEAAEILIGLLLDGHIRIQDRPAPRP